ncbi:hypothetical protein Zmor_024917 [Zophobas morio]|uniref:Uncharacterized protein n=1 Tax=Zophobas morio TaxID=2755281 RepID=A0AA38HQX4_9CUCU|nr:hypothetical protein Zmor_024917 [Zophobas morio]
MRANVKIATHRPSEDQFPYARRTKNEKPHRYGPRTGNFDGRFGKELSSTNIEAHCCWKTVQPAPAHLDPLSVRTTYTSRSAIFERAFDKNRTERALSKVDCSIREAIWKRT